MKASNYIADYSIFLFYRTEKLKNKEFSLLLNPKLDISLLKWMVIYSVRNHNLIMYNV